MYGLVLCMACTILVGWLAGTGYGLLKCMAGNGFGILSTVSGWLCVRYSTVSCKTAAPSPPMWYQHASRVTPHGIASK